MRALTRVVPRGRAIIGGFAKLFMDLDVSSLGKEKPHKPVLPGTLASECRGVEGVSSLQDGVNVAGATAGTGEAERHWYALKVFYNRVPRVRELFSARGYETYVAMQVLEHYEGGRLSYEERPIVGGLLFVRCDERFLLKTKLDNDNLFLSYYDRGSSHPAVIRDSEMAMFIKVTSIGDPGLEYIGEEVPDLHKGQRVRVTAGLYEGVEGRIRRIGRDRRVLVALNGVAVVALSFIHPSLLEPITGAETPGQLSPAPEAPGTGQAEQAAHSGRAE